jgi:hypothetical protein
MARWWRQKPGVSTPGARRSGVLLALAIAVTLGNARATGAQGLFSPPASPGTVESLPSPAASPWGPAASEPPIPGNLPDVISTLQQALDRVAEWVKAIQQAAASALARMIWESPGNLPPGVDPPDMIGRVDVLPQDLRSALDVLLSKLRARAAPGGVEARHQEYVAGSPALAHEAADIVATDEIVTGAAVQQAAATRAVSLAAAAAAGDSELPATVSSAHETGAALARGARSLPSSRAGIELLVAGVGAGMQQQADLSAAVADRLTVLAQQTAEVSQQIGALAATAGALTAREAERDRQALDARLGLADALSMGGRMFQQTLVAAGEPSADEIRLDPLY